MKKLKACLCLALCLVLLAPLALAFNEQQVAADVDKMFSKSKVMGGSVVVAVKGRIVYAREYGFANIRQKTPVTPLTYYRLASITKMVSGIGLMKLVEEGKLNLDEDISTYYGYSIRNPRFKKNPLTLRQLMSHTSSLSENGGFSNLRSTIHGMLSEESNRRANFQNYAPGSQYKYSNFGAGVTGSIIEAVTDLSANRYMMQYIFAPLGIHASYAGSVIQDPQNLSSQYSDATLFKSADAYIRDGYEDYPSPDTHYRTTYGGLWIRSRDLIKLVSVLAGDGSYEGVQLLSPETVRLMRQDQKTLGASVTGDSPYGLFVERNTTLIPGKTIYGHQGMTDVGIVNAYYDPDTQFAFVLLNNGSSRVREDRVGVMARNMLSYLYPIFSGLQ